MSKRIFKAEGDASESDSREIIRLRDLGAPLHPLVRATEEHLRKRAASGRGLLPQKECFEVRVSLRLIERGMQLLDSVVRACEARGYSFSRAASNVEGCYHEYLQNHRRKVFCAVSIGGERVHFNLREFSREPPKGREGTSAGYLVFEIDVYQIGRREWKETKGKALDASDLAEIIEQIERAAVLLKERREEQERSMAHYRATTELNRNLKVQRKLDGRALRELIADTRAANRATAIRDYVASVESGGWVADPMRETWLRWARATADEIDPLTRSVKPWETPQFLAMWAAANPVESGE